VEKSAILTDKEALVKQAGNSDDSDLDSEVERDPGDDNKAISQLSRKDQKAMDREIPWREIQKYCQKDKDAYIQAAKKEFANWQVWGSAQSSGR